MLLTELSKAKRDSGETELAEEIDRIAESLTWEPHVEMPAEVDALFVAYYAAEPIRALVWGHFHSITRH